MHIVHNKKLIKEDIFEGRNSEWFENISGRSAYTSSIYNDFPICRYDVSEQAPEDLIKREEKKFYFDFCSVKVKDFIDWYKKRRPDLEAGWITTYEKWQMDRQGVIPEEVRHTLDVNDNINDFHFVEFVNKYDCSKWLYDYLLENNIDMNAEITYWFDC